MSRTIITTLILGTAVFLGAASAAASTPEPPAAPTQFKGNTVGLGPYSWMDNSDNEDGFRIYVTAGESEPRLAGEFPANTASGSAPTTFEESCKLAALWVVAFNDAGESAPSDTVTLAPPPSGCHETFQQTYTNDTDAAAYRFTIVNFFGLREVRLITNAPGCPAPDVTRDGRDVDVAWGQNPCVDPGESIVLEFDVVGPIAYGTSAWLHPPAADTPTPTLAPTPTPTPMATPGTLPSAGGAPGADSAPLFWLGLAIAAAGVLFLSALGGTARHARPRR